MDACKANTEVTQRDTLQIDDVCEYRWLMKPVRTVLSPGYRMRVWATRTFTPDLSSLSVRRYRGRGVFVVVLGGITQVGYMCLDTWKL